MNYILVIFSFIFGIIASFFISQYIHFDSKSGLIMCKYLGIVSQTIINNYSKNQDFFNYYLYLFVPGLCAMPILWFFNFKNKEKTVFISQNINKFFYLLILLGLYLSFNINFFIHPNADWSLFGEEGQFLSWYQALSNGQYISKDFFSPFGPLMVYIPYLFLKILGSSILILRVCTFVFNIIGMIIIFYILRINIKNNKLYIISGILLLIIYSPFFYFEPSRSILRIAIGLLPIIFIIKEKFIFAGIVSGIGFLLSPEIGVCSALVVVFQNILMYRNFNNEASVVSLPRNNSHCEELATKQSHLNYKSLKIFLRKILIFLLGFVISILPFILVFIKQGVIIYWLDDLINYSRHTILGYANLPIPDFKGLFELNGESIYFYFIIFVDSFVIIKVFFKKNIILLSLLVFQILCFKSALTRSDLFHVMHYSLPTWIMLFVIVDELVYQINIKNDAVIKKIKYLIIFILLMCLDLLFLRVDILNNNLKVIAKEIIHPLNKFKINYQGNFLSEFPRAKVQFDDNTANLLKDLKDFITQNISKKDYIYFFPNESLLYFLFDFKIPTKYPYGYQAITNIEKQKIIYDLEQTKPKYIINILSVWRPDDISENIQLPQVVDYINKKYIAVKKHKEFIILKRL